MPIGPTQVKFFKSAPNDLLAPGEAYLSPKKILQLLLSDYLGKSHYYQDSKSCDYFHKL